MKPELKDLEVLFVDCQTTGTRPPRARVLELGWALGSSRSRLNVAADLIRLPEGEAIPKIVQEITGVRDQDLTDARAEAEVFANFRAGAFRLPEPRVAVIHYAQFEKAFLLDLFKRLGKADELPFRVICVRQLSKKLLPNLPSQNIRAASGFFGAPISHVQRAAPHVQATQRIWAGVVEKLAEHGVRTLEDLETFSSAKTKAKAVRYEYRLDKIKRLELPDSPGVYRMLAKSGEVLYVGKAASLKSRVNSYFRGQKNRDRFKLEMLAQVWDLRVTECKSALEAALLETDEIKRHDPPYNIALKRGGRGLLFYDHEFSAASAEPSAVYRHGPFRASNWIEPVKLLHQSLRGGEFLQIFYLPVAPAILREGFGLFTVMHGLDPRKIRGPRSLLAFGLWLHKHHVDAGDEQDADADSPEGEEREPTAEEIAGKFERLFRRAAVEYLRTKKLTRLLDSDIEWTTAHGERRLRFRGGRLDGVESAREFPWQGLTIDDYDRMSILLSELAKNEHRVI